MIRKYILLALLVLFSMVSFAQKFEEKLLHSFCDALVKNNERFFLQKMPTGLFLVIDPNTGIESIKQRDDTLVIESSQFLRKYGIQESIEILNAHQLPFFPLKDTVCIIDTTGFLLDRDFEYKNGKFFRLVNHYANEVYDTINKTNIIIYKEQTTGNTLNMIFFRRNDTYRKWISFDFDLSEDSFKLIRCSSFATVME